MATTRGINEVLRSLRSARNNIKNKSIQGLIKSAILVRQSTEKENPLTPEHLSNLVHSFFVTTPLGVHDGKSPAWEGKSGGEMEQHHSAVISKMESEVASSKEPAMIMGYSANYALWVHEMVDMNINWTRSGSGPKWFEKAISRNKDKMLKAIGHEIKIALTKNYARTKMLSERTEIINIK